MAGPTPTQSGRSCVSCGVLSRGLFMSVPLGECGAFQLSLLWCRDSPAWAWDQWGAPLLCVYF